MAFEVIVKVCCDDEQVAALLKPPQQILGMFTAPASRQIVETTEQEGKKKKTEIYARLWVDLCGIHCVWGVGPAVAFRKHKCGVISSLPSGFARHVCHGLVRYYDLAGETSVFWPNPALDVAVLSILQKQGNPHIST